MHLLYGLFLFATAGMMNGSFALPSKSISQWTHQKIWLHYSLWAFLIFPLLIFYFFAPTAFTVYEHASTSELSFIFLGGLLFAIGQICFAHALKTIGLGLGFVINISLGTAFGSLIPLLVQHLDHAFDVSGMLTIFAVMLIIVGVFVSYAAGSKRDRASQKSVNDWEYLTGVGCATIAGFFSAGQNITFSLTSRLQHVALADGVPHLLAANIIWPGFLLATFLPYALYMFFTHRKQQVEFNQPFSFKYNFLTMLMGACWYFSLIFYSAGSLKLGVFGPIIGWALFMVSIILTANWWSWRQGEWAHTTKSIQRLALSSILILISAIMVLAYATFLRH